MIISEAIEVLESALDMFGDVEVMFLPTTNPGEAYKLELFNVDTKNKPAQFTDKDFFIDPGPNRFSRS